MNSLLSERAPIDNLESAFSRLLLANLIAAPEIFASIMNETGLGIFRPLSGAFTIVPLGTTEVNIVNPRGYYTLVIKATVQPSSPVLQFSITKDLVSSVDVGGFTSFDELVPNLYTPVRNSGVLSFQNLSGVSTPSVSYFVQTLQVRAQIWTQLRGILTQALAETIGQPVNSQAV